MQVSSGYAIRNGFVKDRNGHPLEISKYEDKSSIDVTIGEVISHKSRYCTRSSDSFYSVEPQETVYIISNEVLDIPADYVAYVFLKNRLSQKGILAFNTGIIDGGYKGVISTLITNLSMKNIELDDKDKPFFRVVFHKVSMTEEEKEKAIRSMNDREGTSLEKYRSKRSKELLNLPKYFLDRLGIKKQINDELNQKAMNLGVWKLTLVIAIIAIVMSVVPAASKHLLKIYDDRFIGVVTTEQLGAVNASILEDRRKIENLSQRNKLMASEINILKNSILVIQKGNKQASKVVKTPSK